MIFLRLFAGYFAQVIPFAILGVYPFSKDYRFSVRKTRLITLGLILFIDCIFAGTSYHLYLTRPNDSSLFGIVNSIFMVSLIPDFIWLMFLSKSIWQKKLFVFSFLLTSAFAMISVCNFIDSWLMRDTPSDHLPYGGISLLVILLFTVIVTPILLLILRKGYMPLSDGLTKKESSYLAIFSLVLFLILVGIMPFFNFTEHSDPFDFILYVALFIAVFLIYTVFFKMLSLSSERAAAKQEGDYLKHQLEIRDEQYHRFNDSIENTRRMNHDLKHHMLTVRSFINEGKLADAENYLEHCIQTTENYEIAKLCEVPVINWIVSYYQALAKTMEIQLFIRISTPPAKDISIHEADLSVLLGNLLENAVTAAESATGDLRYIRLNIVHSGNMLVITVDNGFDGTLNTDGKHYLSTKANHTGIGLSSIENIAEKYNGGVEFNHEDSVFHSSVMLNVAPFHGAE